MSPIITIKNINKVYDSGFQALKNVSLDIHRGEIIALLGPNGAGKTTLISIICGIANSSSGSVSIDGFDTQKDYRKTRGRIGLVPQELTSDAFSTVWNTVTFSRGLFGKSSNPGIIEKILKELSLWDKKDNMMMTLSGGMKRRVLIAKALSHEPDILFLDEPTAGVDVELRKDMWKVINKLRESGVTIILTTHYIEEAEEIADRIGVINNGELILVEEKATLIQKLGKKCITLQLQESLEHIPSSLQHYQLDLSKDGHQLSYTFSTRSESSYKSEPSSIATLIDELNNNGINFNDIDTTQSSLEEIFVQLVKDSEKELSSTTAEDKSSITMQ
ncbi:MAG: ABC-2 type transport system ATP-binding protein [Paraglaciecola sp.]|jgi:ABC-2 type transport system ATP-binding protein|uniref:ABC transporter ATP-binding protein n=1 Tax=uncultured Paraglaciecola sp. TaxID=1765024 RepID=UPI0025CED2E4|nr:ABC transporter ATP-binding protein [uncultured Paraglaciecola sp.]